MHRTLVLMLILAVVPVAGCTSAKQKTNNASIQIPIKLDLGTPASSTACVRLRNGQMIDPNICCPPLELRDAGGAVVQEFSIGGRPEQLVARPGTYLLVGHDPGGEECVLRIEVICE